MTNIKRNFSLIPGPENIDYMSNSQYLNDIAEYPAMDWTIQAKFKVQKNR